MISIKGYKANIVTKLIDEYGYFKRKIELKRLGKYANEIDAVLTTYNKKSCDETMMVKGFRKSDPETTNRKIHQEDLEKIVAQIAKGIGLNEDIVKIMGKHHDIGHTFLGHSGEWWISNILEDYGIGNFCHNTLGARQLIYSNKVYDKIIEKIKAHNPKISQKELRRIKNDLWLIMDSINAHNGETPIKEYIPEITKNEENFEQEMLNCYTKRGYDKTLVPATPEACLMRLADQISYIPLDMIDGLREGMIRDENGNIVKTLDDEYRTVLVRLGISNELIDECNIKGNFELIAEKLKEILINDVIANSKKSKITMSKDIMKAMNDLKSLNNTKIVNYVVLKEDHETYPRAIRNLMERYKDIILQNGVLNKLAHANTDMTINAELEQYNSTVDEAFIKYICNINEKDFRLTQTIAEKATQESIMEELDIARQCVQRAQKYKEQEELGLEYDLKNGRIKGYIKRFTKMLEKGALVGYNQKDQEKDAKFIFEIIKNKESKNYIKMDERMALSIAANYVATLNDHEFMQLLQDTEQITDEQYKSLTRKYKDIPDLHAEARTHKVWNQIVELQKGTEEEKNNKQEQI